MSSKSKPELHKVAAKIVELKAKLDEVKAKHKAIEDKLSGDLDVLKNYFSERAHEEGISTMKLDSGASVSVSSRSVLKCDNMYELQTFIEESGEYELIELKLSTSGAREYMSKHGELPPSVYAIDIPVVSVRSAKKSS